jgi:hypothetical protein
VVDILRFLITVRAVSRSAFQHLSWAINHIKELQFPGPHDFHILSQGAICHCTLK